MTSAPMLLVLGGASHTAGQDCLRQAARLGIEVWLTDTARNLAAGGDLAAAAARRSAVDFYDPAACVAWAVRQARNTRFLGVYGFREFAVESVAATAAALGVPGNPVPAVRLVRDKFSCRTALARRGFDQPAVACCTSLADARAFAAAHPPGPWVVKPRSEMGSTGLSLVRSADEMPGALAYLAAGCSAAARERTAGDNGGAPEFLVETFQRGEEYSAEGLFIAGQPHVLTITAKQTTGAPHFIETGHRMPAALGTELARTARTTVCDALRATGLCWGIFHVEFWIDGDSVVLGELHARPGGDYIHLMTQLVNGIELHGAVFAQMLGRTPDPGEWRPRGGAAVQYLSAGRGTLTAVTGWDQVLASPDCVRAELAVRPGQRLESATSSAGRTGLVVSRGVSAQDAAERAARLVRLVRFEVAPPAAADAEARR